MAIDTSSIDPLFQQAGQATDQATSLAASGVNLPQQLREAVTGRLESSPLFGQREKAAEQVLTSGSRAREDIGGILRRGQAGEEGGAILSPTQQQSIISARGAADVVPLTSLNDLLTTRIGGVDTAVNTGLNAYQMMLQNAQNLATTKTGQANDAFSRLLSLAADSRAEQELNLKQADAGGGGFTSILSSLLSGGIGQTDVGESPQFSPQGGEGTITENEETGVKWQFQNGQWVPQDTGGSGDGADQNSLINKILGQGVLSGDIAGSDVSALQSLGLIQKPKGALERRKDTELSTAAHQVQNVVSSALKAPPGLMGEFRAQTGRIPGISGGEAERLRRDTRGLAKSLANIFAAGEARVTDEDIERWLELMPKPGDTKSERTERSQNMVNAFISTANIRGISIPPEIIKLSQSLGT